MDQERVISEEEANTNPLIAIPVIPDSDLKNYIVEYVGTKMDEEEVTVHMIAEVLAAEFPEFLFTIAEENFVRGYELGLEDGTRMVEEQTQLTTQTEE